MKNKKGVLVQNIIIGIIILVISAAIIFFFLRAFPYRETIDKEACHQSVILRSQQIAGLQPGQLAGIPLNCKTQEVIISSPDENFIKSEIANQMYDCWWMLGEGKMQFWSESAWRTIGVPGAGTAKTHCNICSIIRFEDQAKDKQIDLLSYLDETKIPTKNITYIEYFMNPGTKLPAELKVDKLDTNKDYALIYMGIKGAEVKETIINFIGLSGGSAFATGAILKIGLGVGLKTALKAAGWVGLIIGVLEAAGQITTFWTHAHASAIHCDGETGGCYALILIPLEASGISEQCQNIESIP